MQSLLSGSYIIRMIFNYFNVSHFASTFTQISNSLRKSKDNVSRSHEQIKMVEIPTDDGVYQRLLKGQCEQMFIIMFNNFIILISNCNFSLFYYSQAKYIKKLKEIMAAQESSSFFRSHEVSFIKIVRFLLS